MISLSTMRRKLKVGPSDKGETSGKAYLTLVMLNTKEDMEEDFSVSSGGGVQEFQRECDDCEDCKENVGEAKADEAEDRNGAAAKTLDTREHVSARVRRGRVMT